MHRSISPDTGSRPTALSALAIRPIWGVLQRGTSVFFFCLPLPLPLGAAAAEGDEGRDGAGEGVEEEDAEQDLRWVDGDEHECEHDDEDGDEGDFAFEVEVFEAAVAHVADHEDTHGDGDDEGEYRDIASFERVVVPHPHHAGDDRRRGGARETLEVALVGAPHLGVEAREA